MQEIANILKIFKSIKLLVKIKNVFFILWKKNEMNFLANPIHWQKLSDNNFGIVESILKLAACRGRVKW